MVIIIIMLVLLFMLLMMMMMIMTIRAVLLTSVSHLTLVLNSSTNILIYCWKVILIFMIMIMITIY